MVPALRKMTSGRGMEDNQTKYCKELWITEATVLERRNPRDLEKKEVASW